MPIIIAEDFDLIKSNKHKLDIISFFLMIYIYISCPGRFLENLMIYIYKYIKYG